MDYFGGLHNALRVFYDSTSFLLMISQQRLFDRIGPTDWAVPLLVEFWEHYDTARQILDSIPATQDIAAAATSSWKLATRQTLDAIADTLRSTAILVNSDGDTQDVLAQCPRIVKGFESVAVSRWPELLPELERLMIAMEEVLPPEDLLNHRVRKLSAALGHLHFFTLQAIDRSEREPAEDETNIFGDEEYQRAMLTKYSDHKLRATVSDLSCFAKCFKTALRLIDALPSDAIQQLSALVGKPWDVLTRRIIYGLQEPIREDRTEFFAKNPDVDTQEARLQAAEHLEGNHASKWPELPRLFDELRQRRLDLKAIMHAKIDGGPVVPLDELVRYGRLLKRAIENTPRQDEEQRLQPNASQPYLHEIRPCTIAFARCFRDHWPAQHQAWIGQQSKDDPNGAALDLLNAILEQAEVADTTPDRLPKGPTARLTYQMLVQSPGATVESVAGLLAAAVDDILMRLEEHQGGSERDECIDDPPAVEENRPLDNPPAAPPATYEKRWFLQKTGLSATTILNAMKSCGVVHASRGDKSHRYTEEEAEKVLRHIVGNAQAENAKTKAKEALSELLKSQLNY